MNSNAEPVDTMSHAKRSTWTRSLLVLLLVGLFGLGLWIVSRPQAMATPVATTLRIETDGKSVVGLDDAGGILWTRNIVDEFAIHPIRPDRPITIQELGEPHSWMTKLMENRGHTGRFQSVRFHGSKEMGLIDCATGHYTSMGND